MTFGAPGPDGSSCCMSKNMSSMPVATRAAKRDIRRMHEHGSQFSLRAPPCNFDDEKKSEPVKARCRCEAV